MFLKLNHRFFAFLFLANILIFASNLPFLLHLFKNPQNKVFLQTHTPFTHDYYLYLSVITQGQSGFWLYRESYTSEPTNPGIFHLFYILTGKFASLFGLWPPVAYHLVRLFSVEVFVIFTYLLAQMVLGGKLAFWAGTLSLLGNIAPPFMFPEKLDFNLYPSGIPWWVGFETLQRLNEIPHHVFGQAMLLLSLIFLILYLRRQRIKSVLFAGGIIFLAGIVSPPTIIPIVFGLPAAFALFFLRKTLFNQKDNQDKTILFGVVIVVFCALASFLLIALQEQQGFPWNMWRAQEINRWNFREPDFDTSLKMLFGLLPLLALPAIIKSIKSGSFEYLFISLWAILPFLLVPFANQLNIPKARLLQEVPFVPLAFLATHFIFSTIPSYKRNILRHFCIVLFLLTTIPVSAKILKLRIDSYDYYASGPQYHLPKNAYNAILFIQKNLPKNSILLSEQMMGNIIPAFSPTISYIGHSTNTNLFFEKEKNVRLFFSQSLTQEEAKEFLKSNKISYIYYGANEKKLADKSLGYHFLKKIYEADGIEIYQAM